MRKKSNSFFDSVIEGELTHACPNLFISWGKHVVRSVHLSTTTVLQRKASTRTWCSVWPEIHRERFFRGLRATAMVSELFSRDQRLLYWQVVGKEGSRQPWRGRRGRLKLFWRDLCFKTRRNLSCQCFFVHTHRYILLICRKHSLCCQVT